MSFEVARRKAGLTQAEVAKALGVDRSAVSLWETGTNKPRGNRMLDLAKLYGCTVDELLKEPANKA